MGCALGGSSTPSAWARWPPRPVGTQRTMRECDPSLQVPAPGCFLLDWEGTWKPQTLCPRRSCSGGGQEAFTLILLFLGKVLVGQ